MPGPASVGTVFRLSPHPRNGMATGWSRKPLGPGRLALLAAAGGRAGPGTDPGLCYRTLGLEAPGRKRVKKMVEKRSKTKDHDYSTFRANAATPGVPARPVSRPARPWSC